MSKPTKKQLEDLAKQIKKDQATASSAEKRLKLNVSFKKAVRKIITAKSPTQEQ